MALCKHFDTRNNLSRFMDPLTKGDYPISMKTLVGNRLPRFTKEQSKAVNGSFDFIGLNYYTARYAQNIKHNINGNISYNTDSLTNQTGNRNRYIISKFISFLYASCLSELRVLYMQKQWKEMGQLLVQRYGFLKQKTGIRIIVSPVCYK
jgi:hypothetical protein